MHRGPDGVIMSAVQHRNPTAVDTALAAIDGDRWNAFLSVDHDAATSAVAAASGPGPLAGVPVAVKDNIDVAGLTTTHGSALFRDAPAATADADAVARLRRAGAVIVGKTHLTELACGTTGSNPHFGDAINPLDPERHPGGSSSGSAIAVAAGYVPVALGSDTGGSIRIPAAACGVVGLKPTFGRTSNRGMGVCSRALDHLGPIAIDVATAARTLAVIQTNHRSGPTAQPLMRPVRVGILLGPFIDDCDDDVRRAFAEAVELIKGLRGQRSVIKGAESASAGEALIEPVVVEDVVEVDLRRAGIDPAAATEVTIPLTRDLADTYGSTVRAAPAGSVGPGLIEWLDLYDRVTADAHTEALAERSRLIAAMARVQGLAEGDERIDERIDLLVCPTMRAAPCLRSTAEDQPRERRAGNLDLFDLTGQPSLTVPFGTADCGLPLGLCISGRPGEDATVLGFGAAIERAAR